jgi:hypothetical protein
MLELSLHILDVAENSTRAGAKSVYITLEEETVRDILSLEIQDDGSGMEGDMLRKATDPFFTTKTVRNVGLGLPMLAEAAERAEGKFILESKNGEGTRVAAEFRLSHIDRQPLGDIAATLVTLIAGNADVDFIYRHRRDWEEYTLDTREIRLEIEELPINTPDVLALIRESVRDGLNDISSQA